MKKLIIWAFALIAFSASAIEGNTVTYAHGGASKGALRPGIGIPEVENSAAALIPAEIVNRFAGSYITAVHIISGCVTTNTSANAVTDAQVFVTSDLDNPGALTPGRLSKKAQTWSEITLDKPYLLEKDKPVYAGFTVIRPTDNDAPFVYDRVGDPDGNGFWVNYINDEGTRLWENWSETYGKLLLKLTIQGPTVASTDIVITDLNVPAQVSVDAPFQAITAIQNFGADDVTSISYRVQVGKGQIYAGNYDLPSPLNFNNTLTLYFNPVCSEYGAEIPVKVEITKVNGIADENPADNYREAPVFCLAASEGFPRVMVLEEGTGTWCGNCPRGLYACEYLTEKYPQQFIAIGVHRSDLMEINSGNWSDTIPDPGHDYRVQLSKGLGYPHAFYSRDSRYGTSLGYLDQVESYYKDITALPALCSIKTRISYADEDHSTLNVVHNTEFVLDNSIPYRIATVLVENKVGPYMQQNYYNGVTGVPVGDWSEKAAVELTMFNDVLRYVDDYNGIENSVPVDKKSHAVYTFATKIPTNRLKSRDDFDVIGLLINANTGVIENAYKVAGHDSLEVEDLNTGIESAEADALRAEVRPVIGGIEIRGEFAGAMVVSLNGTVVKTFTAPGFTALNPGLYIVNIDGHATKLTVR